jgi:hypothetical protein
MKVTSTRKPYKWIIYRMGTCNAIMNGRSGGKSFVFTRIHTYLGSDIILKASTSIQPNLNVEKRK